MTSQTSSTPLYIIVAMTRDRVIGNNNSLPWQLPNDLAYFKEVTMGKAIIMGRKTFESIGRVLPGRPNIVVTRNANYSPSIVHEKLHIVPSLEAARQKATQLCPELPAFLIGGGELFALGLEQSEKLFITWIDRAFEGDSFFPDFDINNFLLLSQRSVEQPFPHHYCVYERVV